MQILTAAANKGNPITFCYDMCNYIYLQNALCCSLCDIILLVAQGISKVIALQETAYIPCSIAALIKNIIADSSPRSFMINFYPSFWATGQANKPCTKAHILRQSITEQNQLANM